MKTQCSQIFVGAEDVVPFRGLQLHVVDSLIWVSQWYNLQSFLQEKSLPLWNRSPGQKFYCEHDGLYI